MDSLGPITSPNRTTNEGEKEEVKTAEYARGKEQRLLGTSWGSMPATHPAEAHLTHAAISPIREMAAYEALWVQRAATFKSIAECFRQSPGAIPSELVDGPAIETALSQVIERLSEANVRDVGIRVHGAEDYPQRLRDAVDPIELLYFRGWWDLIDAPKTCPRTACAAPGV
jgi:hypothetical protein